MRAGSRAMATPEPANDVCRDGEGDRAVAQANGVGRLGRLFRGLTMAEEDTRYAEADEDQEDRPEEHGALKVRGRLDSVGEE